MSVTSHSDEMLDVGGALPAFVARAQDDARYRAMLTRLGYRKVKAAYAQQQRAADGSDTFDGLDRDLSPPMDLVRDWLKAERRRILARVRWTFLGAMLATIVTGFALAAAVSILS